MAEASNGGNGGGGVEGRLRNEVEASGPRIGNQMGDRASATAGAGGSSVGGGNGGHAAEVGDGGDRRTPVPEGCTPVGFEAGGPWVSHLDFQNGVEGLVVSGAGSIGAGSSSSGGDVQSGSPRRDPARGKDPAVAEETLREAPVERPEFIPTVGSSGHDHITKRDFAEFMGDDVLAQLLAENPTVVTTMLAAREERQR